MELIERASAIIQEGTLPVVLPLILCSIAIWILILERGFFLFDTALFFWWPPLRQKHRQLKQDVADSLDEYLEGPTTSLPNRTNWTRPT